MTEHTRRKVRELLRNTANLSVESCSEISTVALRPRGPYYLRCSRIPTAAACESKSARLGSADVLTATIGLFVIFLISKCPVYLNCCQSADERRKHWRPLLTVAQVADRSRVWRSPPSTAHSGTQTVLSDVGLHCRYSLGYDRCSDPLIAPLGHRRLDGSLHEMIGRSVRF